MIRNVKKILKMNFTYSLCFEHISGGASITTHIFVDEDWLEAFQEDARQLSIKMVTKSQRWL